MRDDDYDPKLSNFDIDRERGRQGELWISDIRTALAEGSATIEVKNDFRFMETKRFYVEVACRGRDGIWRPSGIKITKADLWVICFGNHPGALVVTTSWLRRAVTEAELHDVNRVEFPYGKNPTRGITVDMNFFHLTAARS